MNAVMRMLMQYFGSGLGICTLWRLMGSYDITQNNSFKWIGFSRVNRYRNRYNSMCLECNTHWRNHYYPVGDNGLI